LIDARTRGEAGNIVESGGFRLKKIVKTWVSCTTQCMHRSCAKTKKIWAQRVKMGENYDGYSQVLYLCDTHYHKRDQREFYVYATWTVEDTWMEKPARARVAVASSSSSSKRASSYDRDDSDHAVKRNKTEDAVDDQD
jgi:hypothetical protein